MNKSDKITALKVYIDRIKEQMPTAGKALLEFFQRELTRTTRKIEDLSK